MKNVQVLDQRKEVKMQWLQDTSQMNVDNLNCVKPEVSRHFRNKAKGYLKAKIEELESRVRSTLLGFCIGA